jgi:hypothetical protein
MDAFPDVNVPGMYGTYQSTSRHLYMVTLPKQDPIQIAIAGLVRKDAPNHVTSKRHDDLPIAMQANDQSRSSLQVQSLP